MNHIKKFESFDFSKVLPIASASDLTMYYNCNDCNALWESFNDPCDKCRFCDTDNIKELDEDGYYDMVESRLEDDEVEDLRSEREKSKDKFVNLFSLKAKEKKRYVN